MPIIHYRIATTSPVGTDGQFLCEIHSWLSNYSGLLIIKRASVLLENSSNGKLDQIDCLFTFLFEI